MKTGNLQNDGYGTSDEFDIRSRQFELNLLIAGHNLPELYMPLFYTPTYAMHIPLSILTATIVSPFIPLIFQANALAT